MSKPIVLAFFFFSGAFSLVYELSWVRMLTFVFGSTVLSASTVVSVYMGGLGLGAWLAGRKSTRISRPVRTYGLIEISLAIYVLTTPLLFSYVLPVFDKFRPETVVELSLVRFAVSCALLLFPTLLMGATLPILAKNFAQHMQATSSTSDLYAINTIGAVVGTLVTGFVLLPALGVSTSIYSAGVANVLLGGAAIFLSAGEQRVEVKSSTTRVPIPYAMLLAVMMAGFAALVSEIVWARVVALVLGPSVFAFTIVLGVFLFGLGFGALLAGRWVRSLSQQTAFDLFFFLALLVGASIAVTSASFSYLPEFFRSNFWDQEFGEAFLTLRAFEVMIVATIMLLPTLLMGMLFPIALRAVSIDSTLIAPDVGRLYGANTIGTVVGAFLAGFFLIPMFGIRYTLGIAIVASTLSAMLSCYAGKRHVNQIVALATLALVLTLLPDWDRQLISSAMYKYATTHEQEVTADELKNDRSLLYYRDGRSATVTVTQDIKTANRERFLATNGKIDGSSHFDMPTQRLLAHVPLLIHEGTKTVCVLGLGTGVTAGSATLYESVESVSVIEIEPAMVEGAAFFSEESHDVLTNDKVELHVTDGRLYLRQNPDSCDVVISEPSNPWISGTTYLFTKDFYELAAKSMKEKGAFAQWVQLYGLAPRSVKTLVRTFVSVFPHTMIFSTLKDVDILLLGFEEPTGIDIAGVYEKMAQPAIAADLSDQRVGVDSIYEFLARMRLGPEATRVFMSEGSLNTDDKPEIVYMAAADFYQDTRPLNKKALAQYADGICPGLRSLRGGEFNFLFGELEKAYREYLGYGAEAANCADEP